jgi:hypothetical protein
MSTPALAAPPARSRLGYAAALLVVIGAGLASRRFPSLLPSFLGKYPGDFLWAVVVFLGWGIVLPKTAGIRIAALAMGSACAVEFLKLCPVAWLDHLRHTTSGHLVLGHVFSWQNLATYAAGIVTALLIEFYLGRRG